MNHGVHCPTFALEYAQLSGLGMRRMNNQDALAVVVTEDRETWANRGHLLMVADGMGAHAAGELASKLAVDNVTHAYFKLRDLYPPAALRQAIREANALIHMRGQSSIGFQGMGTTCTCLVLLPQGALVAHVGDSRVYRLRGHRLSQLTFDHSLVWEMAAAGHMAEEDVPAYIPKNVITRSLGPHETVNIDLEGPYDVQPGDVFLVCSDGMSGQVPDAELGALLHCLSPKDVVQTLVDLANLRGGPDNISVVVARVVGDDAAPPASQPKELVETPSGRASRARRESLLHWAVAAALLALAFCLVNQFWTAAVVSAAALATTVTLIFTRRAAAAPAAMPLHSLGGPYGNGPYRETDCQPNQKVVQALADEVARLDSVREGCRFQIDWTQLKQLSAEAQAAAERHDYCSAIRSYTEGIRQIMQQFREQRATTDTDSGIHPA